jgi:cation:H+ antiporter
MGLDVVMLLLSLALVLLASLLFTNAVERLGLRLGMHQGAVGSILAAVGTALPETVIPVIAILWFRDARAADVAVGAIAGAPFMLATLAFFVTGAAVIIYSFLGRRSRVMRVDSSVISRDLSFFLVAYLLAVLTTFVPGLFALRIVVAIGLLVSYVFYVRITVRSEAHQMEEVDHLYLARLFHSAPAPAPAPAPSLPLIILQLVLSIVIMLAGAHMFVNYVEALSILAGVSPLILSLILTPIATELPEKCNSVIWIGRSRDTLALGNITGAMVFQSCFPVAFGVLGTPWDLCANHYVTLVSALLALACVALVLFCTRKKSLSPWLLLIGAPAYALFVAYILFTPS